MDLILGIVIFNKPQRNPLVARINLLLGQKKCPEDMTAVLPNKSCISTWIDFIIGEGKGENLSPAH